MKKSFFPLLICLVALTVQGNSQGYQSGSTPLLLPDPYYKNFNVSLPVYNGRFFYSYPPDIKGFALTPEDHWAPVTVLYDGIWYNVSGRYDRHADELVLRNPDSTSLFVVNRNRVGRFIMEGRTFVKMDTATAPSLNGYYEVISDGMPGIFIKRGMLLHEDISGTTVERDFVIQDFYYVRKNGKFHQVRTKSNLFDLIPEKKNQVQKEMKNQKIKFRKDPEAAIRIVAGLYK